MSIKVVLLSKQLNNMKLKSTKKSVHKVEVYEIEKSDLKITKSYINDKLKSITLSSKGPHGSTPFLVKPSFNEFILKSNPFHDYEGGAKHCYNDKEMLEVDIDKAVKESRLYYWYGAGNVLFDIRKDPVPLPHTFDYMATDFHSKAMNLEKAIEVLKKHPWVLNKTELKIYDVPHYNSDGYNHRYLSVTLKPDSKSFKKMYQMSLKGTEEFFSCRLKELVHGKCYAHPKWDPLKLHKLRIKREED